MVKRVPADIADIVYSGPVRGYAHKLWNLPVSGPFLVQCNECGEEHSYDPADVLKARNRTTQWLRNPPAISIEDQAPSTGNYLH